jgi:hypothetical protein
MTTTSFSTVFDRLSLCEVRFYALPYGSSIGELKSSNWVLAATEAYVGPVWCWDLTVKYVFLKDKKEGLHFPGCHLGVTTFDGRLRFQ